MFVATAVIFLLNTFSRNPLLVENLVKAGFSVDDAKGFPFIFFLIAFTNVFYFIVFIYARMNYIDILPVNAVIIENIKNSQNRVDVIKIMTLVGIILFNLIFLSTTYVLSYSKVYPLVFMRLVFGLFLIWVGGLLVLSTIKFLSDILIDIRKKFFKVK
jgi:hypothetical protein